MSSLPGPVLAIVAPSFNHLSETFIADHVRTLAPGRTVLVSQDGRGSAGYGCPVLAHVQPAFTSFGPLDAKLKELRFRLRRRFGPALSFDDRMRFIAFLKEHDVGVVLAEYGPTGVLAADVCAALGLPLHVIFHGLDASALLRHATIRRRYRHLFARAASVICVSRALADRLVATGCPESLVHIVPCGVDEAEFAPGTPEPGRVLAIGRLVEKKAPQLTIRAFAEAAARFPEARLDVVGDGPLRAACEAAVAETGLGGRVTLHGALPHHACGALLRRAAIFAQHSVTAATGDTEGSPVAIAEAMATRAAGGRHPAQRHPRAGRGRRERVPRRRGRRGGHGRRHRPAARRPRPRPRHGRGGPRAVPGGLHPGPVAPPPARDPRPAGR